MLRKGAKLERKYNRDVKSGILLKGLYARRTML